MILFLDLEHASALEDAGYREMRAHTMERRRQLYAELSGSPCVIRPYTEFRAEELCAPDVTALVTSGNRSLWENYDLASDFAEFAAALRETSKPVLGICGGHQLIGMLSGGEAEALPKGREEYGFFEVSITARDPLFEGFRDSLEVNQQHFWHVTRLPDSFSPLASSANCPVQAMRHRERRIYGVQFHPEYYDDAHPDGRRLLANFFSL